MIIFTIYDIKIKGFQVNERYEAKQQQMEILNKIYEHEMMNKKMEENNDKNV